MLAVAVAVALSLFPLFYLFKIKVVEGWWCAWKHQWRNSWDTHGLKYTADTDRVVKMVVTGMPSSDPRENRLIGSLPGQQLCGVYISSGSNLSQHIEPPSAGRLSEHDHTCGDLSAVKFFAFWSWYSSKLEQWLVNLCYWNQKKKKKNSLKKSPPHRIGVRTYPAVLRAVRRLPTFIGTSSPNRTVACRALTQSVCQAWPARPTTRRIFEGWKARSGRDFGPTRDFTVDKITRSIRADHNSGTWLLRKLSEREEKQMSRAKVWRGEHVVCPYSRGMDLCDTAPCPERE